MAKGRWYPTSALLQDGVGWFAEQPGGAGLAAATVRARPWGEASPLQR